MEIFDIQKNLKAAGINPGDTLMIHGDAIVAAQLLSTPRELRLDTMLNEIIDYLTFEGTLIVPSFSYSFTRNETFNVDSSEGRVGLFSEAFRKKFPNARTMHPIFSVVVIGKYKDLYLNTTIEDCFGEGTVFDLLYKQDAKLMNLGCDLMLTYTHYVEQKFGVTYRYFKEFNGNIINKKNYLNKVRCRYYVGDLSIRYSLNLKKMKETLLSRDAMRVVPFERVASYTVSAKSYFQIATEMLHDNQFSLIDEGCYDK
jgi:aminoglycoside 3-N-acetyltransferase